MGAIDDRLRREVEAYFSFVSTADTRRAIEARTFHVLREFGDADFRGVLDAFEEVDARTSVAFLGRDVAGRADVMAETEERGHEVVCHGHRHVKFGDLSYETAHGDLSAAVNAFEDVAGVTPTGFFAPFKETSEGTLRAAADLGFEWVLGAAEESAVPDDVTLVDSVYPHDTRLLEGGESPTDAFSQLSDAAEPGSTFLFHPNMLEYYEAEAEFEAWIETVDTEPVGAQVAGDGQGVSAVMDCLRPLRLV